MKRKSTKVSASRLHRFYFCSPKENTSMDMIAKRIIALKLVEEIFLMQIDDGFIAKIRFFDEPEQPHAYLAKNLSPDFGTILKASQ